MKFIINSQGKLYKRKNIYAVVNGIIIGAVFISDINCMSFQNASIKLNNEIKKVGMKIDSK